MHELHSQIEIDATPEEVWRVLVDVERYHEWNPFIVDVHGVVQHGARLRMVMHPPGGRAVTLKPAVTEVQPKQVFEWWGHLVVRGLFDGRHRFELEPTARGTRVAQTETFTGILVPLLRRSLDTHTAAGFELMNHALKAQVERVRATAGA
jgi:hypothetical protein